MSHYWRGNVHTACLRAPLNVDVRVCVVVGAMPNPFTIHKTSATINAECTSNGRSSFQKRTMEEEEETGHKAETEIIYDISGLLCHIMVMKPTQVGLNADLTSPAARLCILLSASPRECARANSLLFVFSFLCIFSFNFCCSRSFSNTTAFHRLPDIFTSSLSPTRVLTMLYLWVGSFTFTRHSLARTIKAYCSPCLFSRFDS